MLLVFKSQKSLANNTFPTAKLDRSDWLCNS